MAKTYVCKNPACSLGTVGNPGRFTGGITAAQKQLLTGEPLENFKDRKDFGQGFCPNCGQPGKEE
jgi:hypothetical protein